MPVSNGYKKFFRTHLSPKPVVNIDTYKNRRISLDFVVPNIRELDDLLIETCINEEIPTADLVYSVFRNVTRAGSSRTSLTIPTECRINLGSDHFRHVEQHIEYCLHDVYPDESEDLSTEEIEDFYMDFVCYLQTLLNFMARGGHVEGLGTEMESVRLYRLALQREAEESYLDIEETPEPTAKRKAQTSTMSFREAVARAEAS